MSLAGQRLIPLTEKTRSYEPAVDGLRGFAALLVLFCHLTPPHETHLDPHYRPPEIFQFIQSGHTAVLLFFAISGYVIGHTNRESATGGTVRCFIWRRFVRLVPLYLLACLLGQAARPDSWGQVAGNLFFLQHAEGYFGWMLAPLTGNGPLWSLNYEMVYYLAFVGIWWLAPRASLLFLAGLAGTLLAYVAPSGVAFLCSYLTGFLFWLLGLCAAWWLPAGGPACCSITGLLCFAATDRFHILPVILGNKLGLPLTHNQINAGDLLMLPVCLMVLCEASGRRFAFYAWFKGAVLAIPVACLAFQVVTGSAFRHQSMIPAEIMTVLMLISLACPPPALLARFLIWSGGISYALYLLHRPIIWFVLDSEILPSGSPGSYLLRAVLVLLVLFPLAWLLELRLQPRIKRSLDTLAWNVRPSV